ncbi:YybH family protein [Oleiharenicola lentus]|uniref:YybH family protein n=1 Tax=Oleiharenicola lentus TaxID=2508720 RepID=UPI003F66B8C4
MKRFALFVVLFTFSLQLTAATNDAAEVRAVLSKQQDAWNRGDIPAFMEGYWKSDELRFASGGTITHGWTATRDKYLKGYPDKTAMGTLTFALHEVTLLAPDTALVFGKWELTRANDKPWGLFTLTMKKTAEGWRVTSDHTSSAEK